MSMHYAGNVDSEFMYPEMSRVQQCEGTFGKVNNGRVWCYIYFANETRGLGLVLLPSNIKVDGESQDNLLC